MLFNKYYILFIAATLLLFIAMIGVIVLTLNKGTSNNNIKALPKNYNVKLSNVNWKYIV